RAGRLGPGRALRLFTKHDLDSRPEHHPPEIERLDLAGAVLELRAAGFDPGALPWLDPPPPGPLQAATALLRRLRPPSAPRPVTPARPSPSTPGFPGSSWKRGAAATVPRAAWPPPC